MRQKRKSSFPKLIMILLLLLVFLIAGLLFLKTSTNTFHFSESQDIIYNPKRGPYIQCSTSEAYRFSKIAEEEPDVRVILLTLDLKSEIETEHIPQEKLEELETVLLEAKRYGFGIVFRAAYDSFTGDYDDPSYELILGHVKQICTVLNRHTGILMGVQAGFLGPFGEWHTSQYITFDEQGTDYRTRFLKTMLDSLDPSIPVGVRRQQFLREAQEAGLDDSRLGIYNDGLFGSDSDLGTYAQEGYDRQAELAWSENTIQTSFNGGEMPYVTEFSALENAVAELGKLHFSYLNKYYSVDIWDDWEAEEYQGVNGRTYIENHLGYRLSLEQLQVSKYLIPGLSLQFNGTILNSGFSSFPQTGKMYLVLQSGDRQWETELLVSQNGENFSAQDITFPKDFSLSEDHPLRVGLRISVNSQEPQNSLYCVQLANDGITYENGCNWITEYSAYGPILRYNSTGQK